MPIPRSSGVLLHPTSLPGRFGLGDLGAEAFAFVDFLAAAGQSWWQILPLGPTGYGHSPYSAYSAFAGNPLLINLERLVERAELEPDDIAGIAMAEGVAHFDAVQPFKERLLHKAARTFAAEASPRRREAFEDFCFEQAHWLNDHAIFQSLRNQFGNRPWNRWPEGIRCREQSALHRWGTELAETIHAHKYIQFVFFEQWDILKDYANRKGIGLIGDIPIFVAFDSADVWANTRLFHLDDAGTPTVVAGVPPDYFSKTGQRWGNPLYRWERMAEDGFAWWLARFRANLALTDLVRIDHFRGFEACWAIPAEEPTAVKGRWTPVPGTALFEALRRELGLELPLIAEDLGIITPEVEALRDGFALPGMKILQFAFGGDADNPYLPHNLTRDCVVYTGTHDNNTTLGWWKTLAKMERDRVREYLGHGGREMPWDLIRLAQASVARLCILPMQDLLGLGADGRMNVPGQASGNWGWRYRPGDLKPEIAERLARLVALYGRDRRSSS
ncbi:4-alpha-glucanotransferase [Trichloromonas sp.]|uniref:4-alpha-glucanotransferase n=1 Tax=Trichloromonas sp. TaxID=3069249 RepID=UPI002A427073|nr:4-alpha-glucanotransferase [Trichloromonas sp.]